MSTTECRHFRKRGNVTFVGYIFIRSHDAIGVHQINSFPSRIFTKTCNFRDAKLIRIRESMYRENCKIRRRERNISSSEKVRFFRRERPISRSEKQQVSRNEQEAYTIRLSREGAKVDDEYYRRQFSFRGELIRRRGLPRGERNWK